jgi:tetratricopeptide (TPR) repeat protein
MPASDPHRARAIALSLLLGFAGASMLPRAARADEPTAAELTAARASFEEGLALEEKGDWSGALERFERVTKVKVTAAVRFHLGLCREHLGQLVEALDEFERATAMSEGVSDKDQKALASRAQAHVTALRQKLPVLRVHAPAGARLRIDDKPIAAEIGAAGLRLPAGAHVAIAEVAGHRATRREVTLVEGAPTQELELPLGAALPRDESAGDKPSGESHLVAKWVPWTFGALAVASFAGTATMFVLRQGTLDDLDGACAPGRTACPANLHDTYDRGVAYTTAGNVLLGVGIGATVVAGGWLLFGPRSRDEGVSASVGLGSVALTYRF